MKNELVISTDVSGYFKQGIIVGKVLKIKLASMLFYHQQKKQIQYML